MLLFVAMETDSLSVALVTVLVASHPLLGAEQSLHNPLCSVFRKGLVSSLAGQNKHPNMSVCEKGMRSQHRTIWLDYYCFNLRTYLITPHCSLPQDLVIATLKGFALFTYFSF